MASVFCMHIHWPRSESTCHSASTRCRENASSDAIRIITTKLRRMNLGPGISTSKIPNSKFQAPAPTTCLEISQPHPHLHISSKTIPSQNFQDSKDTTITPERISVLNRADKHRHCPRDRIMESIMRSNAIPLAMCDRNLQHPTFEIPEIYIPMATDFSVAFHSFAAKTPTQRPTRGARCQAASVSNYGFPAKNISEATLVDKSIRILDGKGIEDRALRALVQRYRISPNGAEFDASKWTGDSMTEAYARCAYITSEYAKTFYLGTKLMIPAKAKATWAVYVWCRRTDELVDGPNASRITPDVLDRWEERLEAIFEGRPVDILDAALSHAVSTYPMHIQPFRDMIGGMRMDLEKMSYNTFEELYEYCYRVAGSVGLMTAPIMGIDPGYGGPLEPVYKAALSLGTANQLTNILRDVGEDAQQRGRIYVPLDDLDRFGIKQEEVLNGMLSQSTGTIDDRWKAFMKFQIDRARMYYAEAESGVNLLQKDARWPVWSALVIYRQILDAIEENNYNNFTKRAFVKRWQKVLDLPLAFAKSW